MTSGKRDLMRSQAHSARPMRVLDKTAVVITCNRAFSLSGRLTMRPFRHVVSSFAILILATGALGACSSSSGKPNDGGKGGSTGSDAGADAPKDTPASTDTQVSDAGFDYGFADGPTSPADITLTIAALAGGTFPDANTCAGVNVSPQMSWTAGPTGTMSYAITLTALDFMNAAHWVTWDIPASGMM